MTSASELFYQRRSRVGRATSDLRLEPSGSEGASLNNYNRRHQSNRHHIHRDRRELDDGFDPSRRFPHGRHPCHRHSTLSDRPSVWLDQGTSPFVPTTSMSTEILSSRSSPRSTRSERLPGAVLLARERLLERLRGVSISANRQSGRALLGSREFTLNDDLRVVDSGDWGTDISVGGSSFTDWNLQTERRELSKPKPPGLTAESLDCLQSEVYRSLEKNTEGEASQGSWDCSICLESFTEGDELIRLPCEHRFHAACLDPWVRTCGDCPYCRRDIVVSSRTFKKR